MKYHYDNGIMVCGYNYFVPKTTLKDRFIAFVLSLCDDIPD